MFYLHTGWENLIFEIWFSARALQHYQLIALPFTPHGVFEHLHCLAALPH